MATEISYRTKAPRHGVSHMNAGGYNVEPQEPASGEHQSSCFAWKRKKGKVGRAPAERSRTSMRRGPASNFAVLKVWQATNRTF